MNTGLWIIDWQHSRRSDGGTSWKQKILIGGKGETAVWCGIIRHIAFYPGVAKDESEAEAEGMGPLLRNSWCGDAVYAMEEFCYEFAGRHVATLAQALAIMETVVWC